MNGGYVGIIFNRKIRIVFLTFVFFCTFSHAVSIHASSLTSFEYIEDTKSCLTFEQIRSPECREKFRNQKNGVFNFGIIDHTVWIRARLPQLGPLHDCPALAINSPGIKKALLFLPVKKRTGVQYEIVNGGLTSEPSALDWQYRFMIYTIPQRAASGEWLYFKFRTGGHTANFTMSLNEPTSLRLTTWMEMGFLTLCIGILAAMILYNTSLYLFLRDRNYLLYVIYILSMFGYQLCHSGVGRIAGFPELINYAVPVSAVTYILALAFTQQFLNTRENIRGLNRFMYGVMALSFIALGLSISGNTGMANRCTHVIGVLGPVTMVIAGILRMRQGFLPARYYLAAWVVLCISIVVLVLVGFKIIPYNFVTYNAHVLGSALESILLSMALGDRVRIIQQERMKLKEDERRLTELSITDELTGLYNKRGYVSRLHEEMKYAKNNRTDLSLMVMDIDYFKMFNDTYGHGAGDRLLAKIGATIIQCIRGKDIPCRYGGEEFVIVLPGSSLKETKLVAERIRQNIENQRIPLDNEEKGGCTVSIGLTAVKHGDSDVSFFERADAALYHAKSQGRNNVVTA